MNIGSKAQSSTVCVLTRQKSIIKKLAFHLAALNMARPVNFMAKFLTIERRAQQITNLLRARSYILSVKNDRLSTETIKRLQDTHLLLKKFEKVTKSIIELDEKYAERNVESLTEAEICRRETLVIYWRDLKRILLENIYNLEGESNLLRSLNAPEHCNLHSILEDLVDASIIFKMQFDNLHIKPTK